MNDDEAGLRHRERAWLLAQTIDDDRWRELVTLALGTATALRISRGEDDAPFDLLFFVEALVELGRQEAARRLLA